MADRIAYLRPGPLPHANSSFEKVIRRSFPEFEVEVIDVFGSLVNPKELVNLCHAIEEYGPDLLLGRKTIFQVAYRTSYIFRKINEAVSKHLGKGGYAFSIQIQSLFDASIESLPHFVYTDHTNLANLFYPAADSRKCVFSRSWLACEKTIYEKATMVFTRSANITNSVVEQYGINPAKVACVYAGPNAYQRAAQTRTPNYSNKHILFVGMDWKRKGGPELIEAFKSVRQIHPDAQLTIVGCAPPLSVENCRAIGKVPLEAVNRFYHEASIFCLPTKLEPFGVALVEAMLYKLPIVATNVGAIPEFVVDGRNGYLLEPGNVEQLANALLKLLDDPKRRAEFGAKSHSLLHERYSWERVGAEIKKYILPSL